MTKNYYNEKFWLEDPQTLISNVDKFNSISSFTTENFEQNSNCYTRLVMLLTLILFIITKKINYIYIGIFLILVIIIMYYFGKKDAFENYSEYSNNLLQEEQLPRRESDNFDINASVNNPLKNVPITDYNKKSEYSKASTSNIDMSQFINDKVFQTADQYIFDRGTRHLYTMPNSSVPNDQGTFAQWLYGTESNCKEGSIYMHRAGPQMESCDCSGYDVTAPTNYGNLNDYKSQ